MKYGHFELKDFHKDNYRLYNETPDINFSPERNYAVIKKVVANAYKRHTEVDSKVIDNAGNVADIIAHFAKYKLDRDGGKQIEEWLGKEQLTKIYGEKLMEKLRVRDSIQKLNRARGNTNYLDFYLT